MTFFLDQRVKWSHTFNDAYCNYSSVELNKNELSYNYRSILPCSSRRALTFLILGFLLVCAIAVQIAYISKEHESHDRLLPITSESTASPTEAKRILIENTPCSLLLGEHDETYPKNLVERLASRQLACRQRLFSQIFGNSGFEATYPAIRNATNESKSQSQEQLSEKNKYANFQGIHGNKMGKRSFYDFFMRNLTEPEQLQIASKMNYTLSQIWEKFPGNESLDIFWKRDIEIRRINYQEHGTTYGCPRDPSTIAKEAAIPQNMREKNKLVHKLVEAAYRSAITRIVPKDLSPNLSPGPRRIALLFLITASLKQDKIWTEWLNEARTWSLSLFDRKEGPYANISSETVFSPLYSLHVHFVAPRPSLYSEVQRIWQEWGNSANTDSFLNHEDLRWNLPPEFQEALIPEVQTAWGDLNGCEYHLLSFGLRDTSAHGFFFISDTTIPVKPFSFIYNEYSKNPRTRMFFQNINLPNAQKHHQWIVLSRSHAYLLVNNPTKWVCDRWLLHSYPSPYFVRVTRPAAPDEYLPFNALSDLIGLDKVLLEINDGQNRDLHYFEVKKQQDNGVRTFRHTWLCWSYNDVVIGEDCSVLGTYGMSFRSPVSYSTIIGDKFEEIVIRNRASWFARKFSANTIVKLQKTQYLQLMSNQTAFDHESEKKEVFLDKSDADDDFVVIPLSTWFKLILEENYFSSLILHDYD